MHPRHAEVIYEAPGSAAGLYYHGFKVYPGEGWRWAYDVTALIERDKLSEDRQLRNVNVDELFKKVVRTCPGLPPGFYHAILNADENAGLPPDIASLQHAVYALIDHGDRNPGGFKMASLEAAIERRYGPKVAYTTETDPASTKHYFARAAGYPASLRGGQLAPILAAHGGESATVASLITPCQASTGNWLVMRV